MRTDPQHNRQNRSQGRYSQGQRALGSGEKTKTQITTSGLGLTK